MKKIFLKHKILILAVILALTAIIGTKIILSQWAVDAEEYVYLSTQQISPQGRYDTIAARRYFDLKDTTADTDVNKMRLDPSGDSFVEVLRTQDNGASLDEIGCAELVGVVPGTRTEVDDVPGLQDLNGDGIDDVGDRRFIRFSGVDADGNPLLPDARLSGMRVDGNLDVGTIAIPGWIEMWVTEGMPEKHVYDIAEGIEGKDVEKNDVVIINPDEVDQVMTTDIPYDTRVAGVISEDPGIYLASGGNKLPLSLKGKAYCKATAINGPIKPGDLLVTSAKKGYAMVGDPTMIKPGMVIGRAMESLEQGEGKILIWVSPG